MGYPSYSAEERLVRATSSGYFTKSADEIFTQSKVRRCHELMNPLGLKFRECRDSENHPNTVAINVYLDVTGSMTHIPADLIKDGLPTMMDGFIQRGVKDAAVCFCAVGDHEVDSAPLQVGQFESGDKELDLWLERTWLEKGGGANYGESYLLAYYNAARHTSIDCFEKRRKKGFLFTIGDEPPLKRVPARAIKEIYGPDEAIQGDMSIETLLKEAQEKYHVYHINVIHGGRDAAEPWKALLGQNCINVTDYTTIPKVIADIVVQNCEGCIGPVPTESTPPVSHDESEVL